MLDSSGDSGPPCGVPSVRARLHQTVRHHAGFEIPPDQCQHACVVDLRRQLAHQQVVVDPIEELLQIEVHHPALAARHILLRATQRLMGRTPRSKAVACVRKRRLEDRLQPLMQRLLDEAIHHRRNAERSHPALRLGDVYPAYRLRSIRPGQQAALDRGPVLLQVAFELGHGERIHARRTLVRHHPLIRKPQVAAIHYGFHQARYSSFRFRPRAGRQFRLGASSSRPRIPSGICCTRLITRISFCLHRLP